MARSGGGREGVRSPGNAVDPASRHTQKVRPQVQQAASFLIIVTPCNAKARTTGTGAVDRMCRRPWVLVAVEVPLVLDEVPSDGRGSGG